MISDRYADATVAYQGAGRGFEPELICTNCPAGNRRLKPDLTLLFDVPVKESTELHDTKEEIRQALARSPRIEHADFQTVRDAYLQIAAYENPSELK